MNSSENTNIQEFIEYIIKSIVSKPNDVIIERNMNSYDEAYTIHVASEDMGVLIGKKGKNINAIRNIVMIKAIPQKIYIQIAEQA